jgi:hypothetical protein
VGLIPAGDVLIKRKCSGFDGFAITDERARSVRIIKIDLDWTSSFSFQSQEGAEMTETILSRSPLIEVCIELV